MCGIFAFWARESIPDYRVLSRLILAAGKRGQDGFGMCIIQKQKGNKIPRTFNYKEFGRASSGNLAMYIKENMRIGDVLLFCSRATPETERPSDDLDMLQPIYREGCYLIHNGGVTESVRPDGDYDTELDSEIILAAYEQQGRDMKRTMEYLSGSFAFVMVDRNKQKMYAVTSFNPLAHMYVKGVGYFMHSDNDALGEALHKMTGCSKDGMNVWENWYHHYIEGYTIIETDLHSGMQHKQTYSPNFIHPTFKYPVPPRNKRVYVSASGGIDSGLTAHVLKHSGYEPVMIHFRYGQKAEIAERWAVKQLSQRLGIQMFEFDLMEQFMNFSRNGMLTDADIRIDSGGDNIKSTVAWVPARNAIFTSYLLACAETYLIAQNVNEVYIAAGWAQLSEETGGYPDNSFQFAEAIDMMRKYGTITGEYIKFLPVMRNITKTEEWVLGDCLGFPFECTISCDCPTYVNKTHALCTYCGSTKLSMIAADRAGVEDKRKFADVGGILRKRPKMAEKVKTASIKNIISRLELPNDAKGQLLTFAKELNSG